jgi:glutathione synthase/RimK-type ligase-like ATP-grasp enzyme
MILLDASRKDWSAQKISAELKRRRIDYEWLNMIDTMQSVHLTHYLGGKVDSEKILFSDNGERIELNQVSVIFTRNQDETKIGDEKYDKDVQRWIIRDYSNYFIETLEMLECEWFPGRPSLIYRREDEKLKELYVASSIGLKIPATIVTNDPRLALEFYRAHSGRVISKRYNRARINYQGDAYGAATSPVSLRDIGFIQHVQNSPTLFQEYVPKAKELRVTIIGDKTIAAEIDSQKSHRTRHDWRHYDKKRTNYKEHKLPDEIHKYLVQLTEQQGLHYSTADLVITPNGEYIFLEINPAGQYAWIENTIGIDITGIICDKIISLADLHNKPVAKLSNRIADKTYISSSPLLIKELSL